MQRLMLLLVVGSLIFSACQGRLPVQPTGSPRPVEPDIPLAGPDYTTRIETSSNAAGDPSDQTMGPILVSYTSRQGTVSFPHADHAGRLDCRLCHPTDPPKKILVDQSFAHATCTACHLNSGTGPTSCRECHSKP